MPSVTVRACAVAIMFIAALIQRPPLGNAQEPMPAVRGAQYCRWWQAKVGPAVKPKRANHVKQLPTAEAKGSVREWASAVYAEAYDPDQVAALTDEQVIAAIGCLFQLENDNRHTRFGGGPRVIEVSQLFGPAPVNLAALLYISYLFTRNLNLFTAVALRGPGAESDWSQGLYATSDEAISRAYASYHRWYEEVKRTGLARARDQNLNPLEGTGLSWY